MTKIHSPARVAFLLHCHCDPGPHCEAGDERIAGIRALAQQFIALRAVVPHETDKDRWVTTPRGVAWVDAICSVELPRPAFIDEHGMVLNSR